MAKKTRTKEELFMIALFEVVKNKEEDTEVDAIALGQTIKLHEKATIGILRGLLQANFIKKISEWVIILTPQGRRLVQTLLEE